MSDTALVLFSGGQDSATCLAWALDRFQHVETIAFDYGQNHRVELAVRGAFLAALRAAYPAWATKLGGDHVIDMGLLATISDTALTHDRAIEMRRSPIAVARAIWWAACARPIIPAIPIAETTP